MLNFREEVGYALTVRAVRLSILSLNHPLHLLSHVLRFSASCRASPMCTTTPSVLSKSGVLHSTSNRQGLRSRTQVEVADGMLVIQPLSPERVREATELLTTVFAATDDRLGVYTKLMRVQIRSCVSGRHSCPAYVRFPELSGSRAKA